MQIRLFLFIGVFCVSNSSKLFYDDMSDYGDNWDSKGSVSIYNGDGNYCFHTTNPCTKLKHNGTVLERTFDVNGKQDLRVQTYVNAVTIEEYYPNIGLAYSCDNDIYTNVQITSKYVYQFQRYLPVECEIIKIRFYMQLQDDDIHNNDDQNSLYINDFYICDDNNCNNPNNPNNPADSKVISKYITSGAYIIAVLFIIICCYLFMNQKRKAKKYQKENINKESLVQNNQIQMEITDKDNEEEHTPTPPGPNGLISAPYLKKLPEYRNKKQGSQKFRSLMTSGRAEALKNNDKIVRDNPVFFYGKKDDAEILQNYNYVSGQMDISIDKKSTSVHNNNRNSTNNYKQREQSQMNNKKQIINRIRNNLPRVPNTQLMCNRCGQTWRNANKDGHKLKADHVKHCRHDWNCGICGKRFVNMRWYVNHVKNCTNLQ